MFRQADNPWAWQSVVARMLETVRKQYWKPEQAVVETLAREYAESAQEVGLACCDHTCNNSQLTRFTSSVLLSVPGLKTLEPGFRQALQAMKQPDRGKSGQPTRQAAQQAARAGTAGRAPDGSGKAAKTKAVTGFEMQESGPTAAGAASAPIPWLFMLGFVVAVGLFCVGFRERR
jgi:cobaltochelatase CobN